MGQAKKAMWVEFKMDKKMSDNEWKERFAAGYGIFKDMPAIFSKCWWTNQEKGTWGAYYIFNSDKELQDYIVSDLWTKIVPEKYGAVPEVMIVEPGPILCKEVVTEP